MSTLNSKIILARDVRLDRNYSNVLDYNHNDMINFLLSENHLVASRNDMSFLNYTTREIQVQIPFVTCLQANYIAFQNPAYSNKWFFAWIDNVTFKSNNNTSIKFTIDIFTTYWGDWGSTACLVEREHVANDSIGQNILEEDIPIQNTEIIGMQSFGDYSSITSWVCVLSNWNTFTQVSYDGINIYDNLVFGSNIFLFRISDMIQDLGDFVLQINRESHIEDIRDMFIIPNRAVDVGNLDLQTKTNEVSRAYI